MRQQTLADYEILVVDDGSKDNTIALLEANPGLYDQLIRQPKNGGKGAAVVAGLRAATGDYILFQDADLEYSPEEFPELIELICQGRADVVYGSRFLGRHRVFLFTHYLGNRIVTLATNVLYNTMLTDMETCYKVMRGPVARSLRLSGNRFEIEPEITARLLRSGVRMVERPVRFSPRSKAAGKKMRWRDGLTAVQMLVRCRFDG